MPVLAIVDDLTFRSKLDAAARSLGVDLDLAAEIPTLAKAWTRAIVDLNLSGRDPVGIIQELRRRLPALPITGFGSHVQTELMSGARAAGCDEVLPRSAFVQQLPQLLQG
jgi:DNA-binding NarL/FixJ family response regulator